MATGTDARAAGHAMEPYVAAWRFACLGVVAVWLLIAAVYWSTITAMVVKWYESGTFAHGFLIPPVSLFLAWRQRRAFLAAAPAPALWAAVPLALAGLAWMLGDLAAVLVVQQVALVGIVELVLLMLVGVKATAALAFPLAFAWFAVPFGEFMTAPLQDLTAWFAVLALRLSGVPVLVEGRALTIPTGHWLVAEACSGVRYLIPSLVLGLLFAWITYRRWQRRVLFVLCAAAVPVLANCVRAYAIIMLAHYTQNRIAVGIDHLIYGWVFFGAVMLLLFLIGSRWREDHPPAARFGDAPLAPAHPGARTIRMPLAVALAAIVATCPPVLSGTWFADVPVKVRPLEAPIAAYPWTMTAGVALRPHYLGAASQVSQSYTAGGPTVQLFVAHYVRERQGEELINDGNRLGDRGQWTLTDTRSVGAQLDGETITVQQETMRSRHDRVRVSWTWYWINGQHTLSPMTAKWLRVQSRLLRRPYSAAAITLSVDHDVNNPAPPVLQSFLDHCPTLGFPLAAAS